jgi:5-methyltetrahydrofolate--homocysteine methyltransferase
MKKASTNLRGRSASVTIQPDAGTILIGERCNALGYRSVRESVEQGDFRIVVERAVKQVQAGAHIINVNMVGMNVPEKEALPEAVRRISAAVDVPLSLDFGDIDALVAALEVTPGRALINSVNGEAGKLEPTLEVAQRFNAAVVAIPCDESGVPPTPESRLEVSLKILRKAGEFGLSVDDLLFDAICIGVATDPGAGPVTFETCRLLRKELGANILLGASNVSFGLPKRRTLDAYYLAMAIGAGMNVALTDPTLEVLRWAFLSADTAMGYDEFGMSYIQAFRREEALKKQKEAAAQA